MDTREALRNCQAPPPRGLASPEANLATSFLVFILKAKPRLLFFAIFLLAYNVSGTVLYDAVLMLLVLNRTLIKYEIKKDSGHFSHRIGG